MQYHGGPKAKRVREPDHTLTHQRQRKNGIRLEKNIWQRISRRRLNDPKTFDILSITYLNRLASIQTNEHACWEDHWYNNNNGPYRKEQYPDKRPYKVPRTPRQFRKYMSRYK